MGDLEKAIADYSAAIQLNPVYALAYNNRGYVYEARGDKRAAAADFRRALALDPALVGAKNGLKRLGEPEAVAAESDKLIAQGKVLAEKNCAWCHAIGPTGDSPNSRAPRWRDLSNRHPVLALREPLTRGIARPHDEMPKFELSDQEIDTIVAYINSLSRNNESRSAKESSTGHTSGLGKCVLFPGLLRTMRGPRYTVAEASPRKAHPKLKRAPAEDLPRVSCPGDSGLSLSNFDSSLVAPAH